VSGEYYILIGVIGVFLVLFLSRRNRKKKGNNTDLFPELNRGILERVVLYWAKRHRGIKTVVLYEKQVSYPAPVKYIVYCEFKKKKDADRFEIEHALQPAYLITDNVIEVYKDQTPRPFQYEWWFETKKRDWMKRQPYWLLYKKSGYYPSKGI
jgi:hypothetical protein